ncbi:hypothetical protein [Tateyamaria omphalii]|uniref:Uncharacterized protein n=1 Tax=Tateyamaria omphalii TaxID=299262 RepID=A0A1P8N149_9RHOB|nr:hypothetical protein [Tateyamaria omphalii]APX14044.1 hypothetical protein BWR18_19480 [Tateyamaria omphalii]
MRLWFNRSTMFVGMLMAGAAMLGGTAHAQAKDARAGVTYAGGQIIPAGRIEIFMEDTARPAQKRLGAQNVSIDSDGKSRQIEFPLTWLASTSVSPTLRIVAHLERDDGWLLARGSARIKAGRPISITLNRVMY